MALAEKDIKDIEELFEKLAGMTPDEQRAKAPELLKKLSPEQIEFIKQQQGGGQCPFCGIAKGEIPAKKVYEDSNFMAVLDINPGNPGHVILMPKEHIAVLPQLSDDLAAKGFVLVKKLAGAVFDATNAQGVNIVQNNGAAAGQTVPHLHIHIIPRFDDDKIRIEWDPLKLSEEQFKEMQKRISEKTKDFGKKVYDVSGNLVEEKEDKKDEKKPEKKEDAPKVRRRRA